MCDDISKRQVTYKMVLSCHSLDSCVVHIDEVRKNTITVSLQSCSTPAHSVPKPKEREKQSEVIGRYREGDVIIF